MKIALLLICAAGLFAQAPPQAPNKIIGGPYTVNVTARSATVVWVVDDGPSILHGPNGETRTAPALRAEKTTFTGLQPDTRYDYTVADGAKGSFKTALQGPGPYNFVIYGDTRSRHDVHRKVIERILEQGIPDFLVNSGDQTEDGFDSSLWPIFFDTEKDLLRQTAFYPSLGNHERDSPDYYQVFQQRRGYYSFDWGNAHFSVINSDIAGIGSNQVDRDKFWTEQTKWLEEDLATHQTATFRFLVAHHSPITAVSYRQGSNPHMIALMPMLEKYKLSAALFGHDHNYQHYLRNGIHYLTSGGGGAPLYDVNTPPADITVKVESIENFIQVKVQGNVARFKTIAIDGRTIDEFELIGTEPPAPLAPGRTR